MRSPTDATPDAAPQARIRVLHVWLPVALLLGSGFSALVYQVLWLRLLGLVFGVTIHAAGTVLAAFMGGLALGNALAGRHADRLASPLRMFGLVELLIGATALATPIVLQALDAVYRQVYASVPDDIGVLTLARFLCSFAALIVPTTLMGATLPLVLRASVTRSAEVGPRAAALYAANTSGALAGALITGYYLVSQVGIAASFRLAAAVNLTVGVTAIVWSASARPAARPAGTGPTSAGPDAVPPQLSPYARGLVLAVFALSGFVGLALEIIWFRALVMFLTATTYVFTIILAVVLGGIAAGSALATRALRRPGDWVLRLALLQVAVAIAAIASLAAQAWTYAQGWRTGAALQGSALSVLPAMLLMGAAFPIGLALWTAGRAEAVAHAGRSVGTFYLVNLSGSIAGALAAGFLLIPWLGTRTSLVAVASLSLLGGLLLLSLVAGRRTRLALTIAGGSLVAFAGAAFLLPDPLASVLARRYPGERVVWREEGAQSTVSVHDGERRVMYLDGLHQANDSPEMLSIHQQIGTLAMALHPDPRAALVIGLGGGATAGAVAQFSTAAVDIVELSPAVVRGAAWFAHANGDVLRRPNVRVRVDDGRNYLLLTPRRYDVITADIIQPFHAGAGNLYSLEYFRLAAAALGEGGHMLQWIGQRPRTQYHLIARTFLAAFPHTTVWAGGTLLLGSTQPLQLSARRVAEQLADPDHARAVGAAGIATFEDLVRLFTAGPEDLARFIGDGPVLSDDRPLVEYFLSLPQGDPEVALDRLTGDVAPYLAP